MQNNCKTWQKDSQFYELPKSRFEKNIIKIGTVEYLKEKSPICHWVLGRIEEVTPGRDGKIGVLKLWTTEGNFKRPVTKISIFLIEDNAIKYC